MRSFVDHEVAVAHYVSAYSEGGLEPVEAMEPSDADHTADLP